MVIRNNNNIDLQKGVIDDVKDMKVYVEEKPFSFCQQFDFEC